MAIAAARIERNKLYAYALSIRQNPRQHGREGRQRRPIELGEIKRAGLAIGFTKLPTRTWRAPTPASFGRGNATISRCSVLRLAQFSVLTCGAGCCASRGRFIPLSLMFGQRAPPLLRVVVTYEGAPSDLSTFQSACSEFCVR
jgi:hypothetical protein